jgi:hypothetical protein
MVYMDWYQNALPIHGRIPHLGGAVEDDPEQADEDARAVPAVAAQELAVRHAGEWHTAGTAPTERGDLQTIWRSGDTAVHGTTS